MPSSIYGSKWSRMFQLLPFASKKNQVHQILFGGVLVQLRQVTGPISALLPPSCEYWLSNTSQPNGTVMFVATNLWWGNPYQLNISPSTAPFFGFQGFLGQPQSPTENHQPFTGFECVAGTQMNAGGCFYWTSGPVTIGPVRAIIWRLSQILVSHGARIRKFQDLLYLLLRPFFGVSWVFLFKGTWKILWCFKTPNTYTRSQGTLITKKVRENEEFLGGICDFHGGLIWNDIQKKRFPKHPSLYNRYHLDRILPYFPLQPPTFFDQLPPPPPPNAFFQVPCSSGTSWQSSGRQGSPTLPTNQSGYNLNQPKLLHPGGIQEVLNQTWVQIVSPTNLGTIQENSQGHTSYERLEDHLPLANRCFLYLDGSPLVLLITPPEV